MYSFAGYALTVASSCYTATITDYDLAIRGMCVHSGDRPSAIAYVCSQLREETKLSLILHCPLIAFANNAARFLQFTNSAVVCRITKVVVLQKGSTLDKSEEYWLAEIKDKLERKGAGEAVQTEVRLPDDSPWEQKDE